MHARALTAVVVAALTLTTGCGDDGSRPRLTVSAAASLRGAFEAYGADFDAAKARFSFAGSDDLAAQIRKGVRPDVYAAANTKLPEELFAEGLVERPVVFAGNRLVIAVPEDSPIDSIEDLADGGVDLAIGDPEVPVGSYTREVIARLPRDAAESILANVRSAEPDVAGIVGKLTQGAADAGFLYITDVRGAGDRVDAIELPRRLQPSVRYGITVIKGAKEPDAAKTFIAGLLSGAGREALAAAGFERPR